MGHAPDTKLGRMYKEHIQLILKKDIDGILDQYTPDALLISSFSGDRKPQYFRGHKELREHFQGILGLQGLEVDLTFWAETATPETLMVVEDVKVKTADGESRMRFADSWVLRDGRIAIHFAGMVQYPDGSLA
jgi:ketosteroid isomerase-like protein